MVDTIMQFLTWAIPSGGIGAAIAWIANRKVKQAEQAKQVHDTYKAMYEDISREWIETQQKLEKSAKENAKAIEESNKENARTRNALNRLSRAIEAIQLCPHRATCPVSGELQNGEDDAEGTEPGKPKGGKRQQHKSKPAGGEPEDGNGNGRTVDGASVDGDTSARRQHHDDSPDLHKAPCRQCGKGEG